MILNVRCHIKFIHGKDHFRLQLGLKDLEGGILESLQVEDQHLRGVENVHRFKSFHVLLAVAAIPAVLLG